MCAKGYARGIAMTEDPKQPSKLLIVVSAVMTVYFLYKLLGGGEAMSGTLTAMYWGVVILNLIFLIGTALKWFK